MFCVCNMYRLGNAWVCEFTRRHLLNSISYVHNTFKTHTLRRILTKKTWKKVTNSRDIVYWMEIFLDYCEWMTILNFCLAWDTICLWQFISTSIRSLLWKTHKFVRKILRIIHIFSCIFSFPFSHVQTQRTILYIYEGIDFPTFWPPHGNNNAHHVERNADGLHRRMRIYVMLACDRVPFSTQTHLYLFLYNA